MMLWANTRPMRPIARIPDWASFAVEFLSLLLTILALASGHPFVALAFGALATSVLVAIFLQRPGKPAPAPPAVPGLARVSDFLMGIPGQGRPLAARPAGPGAEDFQKGRIFRPREVNELIGDLLVPGAVRVIYGPPASGKSAILRYVGWEIWKKRDDIWIVDVDASLGRETVPAVRALGGILLVDNAHRNLPFVEALLSTPARQSVLITSRQIDLGARGSGFPRFAQAYAEGLPINSRRISGELITLRLKEIDFAQDPERVRSALRSFGLDLWHLEMALQAFTAKGLEPQTIAEAWDAIVLHMRQWLQVDLPRETGSPHAAEIIFALAAFYQFEIAPDEAFLVSPNGLGLDLAVLEALSQSGEIVRERGRVRLHHSTLSALYLDAFRAEWWYMPALEPRGLTTETAIHLAFARARPSRVLEQLARIAEQWPSELSLAMVAKLGRSQEAREALQDSLSGGISSMEEADLVAAVLGIEFLDGPLVSPDVKAILENSVIQSAKSVDESIRTMAAAMLWTATRDPSRGPRATDELVGLLADPSPRVRKRALTSLVEDNVTMSLPQRSRAFEEALSDARRGEPDAIGQMAFLADGLGPPAFGRILDLIGTAVMKDAPTQRSAAGAAIETLLESGGDPEPLLGLLAILSRSPEEEVRRSAASAASVAEDLGLLEGSPHEEAMAALLERTS